MKKMNNIKMKKFLKNAMTVECILKITSNFQITYKISAQAHNMKIYKPWTKD